VTLDGRNLPTPAGAPLALPSERLALAVAAEWDAQGPTVEPAAMPLTALAATAVDQIGVPKKKQETVGHLLAYAATDSCRFVADAKAEPEVRAKQDELHPPVLDWLLETRGAALPRGARRVTRAPAVDDASLESLHAACGALSDWRLAAPQCATFECKSLALGFALVDGFLDARSAEAAARVEENANIERWGLVEGAHDYDLARIQVQLSSAAFFVAAAAGDRV